MPNPFYIDPTAGHDPNALQGLGQAIQGYQARSAAADAKTQQDALRQEALSVFQTRDPNKVAAFTLANPQYSQAMKNSMGIVNAQQESEAKDFTRSVLANPEGAKELFETRIRSLQEQNRDPSTTIQSYKDWLANPDAEMKDLELVYSGLANEQEWEAYQGLSGGGESNLGTVSPKDFTVESMAAYEASGNIEDLVRYRPKTVKIGNIEHAYNDETQTYEPVVDYSSQELTEQEAAAAENEAMRASRVEFGKQKDTWDNNQPKYLNNISAAEQKQTVVRNTADRIKDLVSVWSTKYGSSLSSVPGSEARTLKGLIDTMKANSAFSTLTDLKAAGGTLGAISEAELNLLERAWGALDQGGDNTEFLRVLEQLVGQNSGSLQRARNAFDMNKKRFSGSYDDAQRQRQDENTVSWDSL